jgi:hypothetical protein
MTIPSAFATFGVGGKLASGDVNTLNTNVQMALDKRTGQTDALASIVSCGGAGRIVDSYAVGPDANTTFLLAGANSIINASGSVTVDRVYSLSNTGAVNGDRVMVIFSSANCAVTVKDNSGTTLIVLGAYVSGAAAFASVGESSWADFVWNGSWQLWRSSKPAILTSTTYTANGTWTCPRGVTLALLIGWGGGGGGGGSGGGSTVVSPCSASGGGGAGGAQLVVQTVAVVAGTAYAVTIGTVGSGGTGGANGSNGNDGGDTLFGSLFTAAGAQGGGGGPGSTTSSNIVQGGAPTRLSRVPSSYTNSQGPGLVAPISPGCGGMGLNLVSGTLALQGCGSIQGFNGGVAGVNGGTFGTAMGGGGGGGGGAGPGGVGGAGSALGGGGSNTGAAASAGATGGSAAANSGGGGAGANGGGQNTGGGSVGTGGPGGSGGSGQLTVTPIR